MQKGRGEPVLCLSFLPVSGLGGHALMSSSPTGIHGLQKIVVNLRGWLVDSHFSVVLIVLGVMGRLECSQSWPLGIWSLTGRSNGEQSVTV